MTLEDIVRDVVNNKIVILLIVSLTGLYTSTIAPPLNPAIKELFQNPYFRTMVILATAFLASARKPVIGLIAGLSFMYISSLVAKEDSISIQK